MYSANEMFLLKKMNFFGALLALLLSFSCFLFFAINCFFVFISRAAIKLLHLLQLSVSRPRLHTVDSSPGTLLGLVWWKKSNAHLRRSSMVSVVDMMQRIGVWHHLDANGTPAHQYINDKLSTSIRYILTTP